MEKPRILVISHQANLSGAPRALLNTFPYLLKHYTLDIVLNQNGKVATEFKKLGDTHMFYGDKFKKLKSALQLLNLYHPAKRIWFWLLLRRITPDLIYINTMGKNIPAQIALRYRKPVIVHFHETDFTIAYYKDPIWIKLLINSTNHFIGCAEYVSDFLKTSCGVESSKVTTIYESIDVDLLRKKNILGNFRSKFKIPADAILVGCAGVPQFRKGTDLFINSALRILTKDKNYYFVWLGSDQSFHTSNLYLHSCLKMIERNGGQNNIFFIPEISNPEEFYHAIDLYVITSREDPFPLSMLEAMAFEKPVIGFRASGIPEALSGENGVLVDNFDPEKLADAILHLSMNSSIYNQISKKAFQNVSENFNAPTTAPHIDTVIQSLLLK